MQATNRKAAVQLAGARAAGSEATRIKMLDAALDIMIEEGIRAVRHRAVAKRAGVSLGSTTYHFASIEEIIISAFEYWRSKALITDSPFYRKTRALLAPYVDGVVPAAERPRIAAQIYQISLGYLRSQLSGKRDDRLLELAFHHESVRYPTLHQLVVREGREQLAYLEVVHRAMGSVAPAEDARLTFSLFRQLEQSAVIEGAGRLDVGRVRRVLHRHMVLCFDIDLPAGGDGDG
ncbi:MAG: TetR family transcriptional regulator [Halioglobus sp.]|nr:TetR family transcriptional regulator [Halioglobus sp.]